MEKLIGCHRKGNPYDSFGFIKSTKTKNLFIHDKEFKDDISRFDGREVYVTFRMRASKIKKGNYEGYDGSSIEAENDVDFLFNALRNQIALLGNITKDSGETFLCKSLILRLSEINAKTENAEMFRVYFEENNLKDIISYQLNTVKYSVMKFGFRTFYPEQFEELDAKLNELQEAEVLNQMGYLGADKYDALTHSFFYNFSQFEKYYRKFPQKVNKEFIYKIILESETLPFGDSFESIKRFVSLIKDNNSILNNESVFELFSNLSTPKIRLYLWLHDLTQVFNFTEYKENVWKLERRDQGLFIKKLFYSKYKGLIDFNLEELLEIKVYNIEHFREIKKSNQVIDYANLDFNIALLIYVMQTISEIKPFENNVTGKIFEYFLEYVKDYKEIQHIDYFYPKCKGRTVGVKKLDNKIESELGVESGQSETYTFNYYHHEYDKPFHHHFCDGQLDKKNILGYPIDKPYSWCAGLPCFDPSNGIKEFNEKFQNWTIVEFLSLLGVKYEPLNIAYLLGYINKANLLIDRLKCTGCNGLLTPNSPHAHTYHIVNNFYCNDSNCPDYSRTVYLNHCFNKNCANIIDSRVSQKCSFEGFGDSCGWYICDTCYSCCASDVIERVTKKKEMHGLTYNCSPVGHDELKHIFCYNCGTRMNLNLDYYLNQRTIINNLNGIKNKDFILFKENKKGFWRFTLNFDAIDYSKRKDAIDKLIAHGFKLKESKVNNTFYVDHLISIALKCVNDSCPNEEVFTPNKPSLWKAFNDRNNFLTDSVKRFYETGEIGYISNH
jgi:hypothetical protein